MVDLELRYFGINVSILKYVNEMLIQLNYLSILKLCVFLYFQDLQSRAKVPARMGVKLPNILEQRYIVTHLVICNCKIFMF